MSMANPSFSQETIEYAEENGIEEDSCYGCWNWETWETINFLDDDTWKPSSVEDLEEEYKDNMPTALMESFETEGGDLKLINWQEVFESLTAQ